MANISYVLGIPATNNNPSEDQPNMLLNNDAVNQIIGIDHVAFNAANGGTHKQVTFSSNNSPGGGDINPPVLFTSNVGSIPQLFFFSRTTGNQYANASNGGTFVLGGIIIKWGVVTMSAATTAFTYAGLSPALQPFPNGSYGVQITPSNNNATNGLPYVSANTVAGFTIIGSAQTVGGTFFFTSIGF